MKYLTIIFVCSTILCSCGTIGGAMQGAGEDLNRAGGYIRNVGK